MNFAAKPLRLVLLVTVVLAAAGGVFVLYGMNGQTVHAGVPPKALDRLEFSKDRPLAPDPGFYDVNGAKTGLSQFRGRHVLLNLWATWCAPCVEELPALVRLQTALGQDLAVVPVDIEKQDASKVTEFFARHDVSALPVFIDQDRTMLRAYVPVAMPLSVLIGPDGHEIARFLGPQEWDHEDAIAYLRALTAKKN